MSKTFLVFGASGHTGQHFVRRALADGHKVRAVVRSPEKLAPTSGVEVVKGSITEQMDLDTQLAGVDYVVAMLGDKETQSHTPICRNFVEQLVPAMRRQGVKRFLYQAGAMSCPYNGRLGPVLWILRNTMARGFGFEGQHRDNEAVMEYLATRGKDIEWMVHLAGIYGDGPSKGTLQRSKSKTSVAQHVDTADYNYRAVMDAGAIHQCEFSCYGKA